MKIVKIIASFLLIVGIIVLMIWAGIRSNKKNCTDLSVVFHEAAEPALLSESDIKNVLLHHNIKWEGVSTK
jgi:hypothetical protein